MSPPPGDKRDLRPRSARKGHLWPCCAEALGALALAAGKRSKLPRRAEEEEFLDYDSEDHADVPSGST